MFSCVMHLMQYEPILSFQINGWNADVNQEASPQIPKIIYASRTHSQLSQVVKELKQTSYGKRYDITTIVHRAK